MTRATTTERIDRSAIDEAATAGPLAELAEKEIAFHVGGPIKSEDLAFLKSHAQQFQLAHTRLPIWRTRSQRDSIISDDYQPTIFGKFRQAVVEQRGMFDEAASAAYQFELAKLELEEMEIRAEAWEKAAETGDRLADVRGRKVRVRMKQKGLQLARLQQEINDRMREVRMWQERIDEFFAVARDEMKIDPDLLWDVEYGEVENCFFDFLTRLKGVQASTDGAEVRNLYALARHGVRQAIRAKVFEKFIPRCSVEQTHAVAHLGFVMVDHKPVNLVEAIMRVGTPEQQAYVRAKFLEVR